jgi:membrane dipeptidase
MLTLTLPRIAALVSLSFFAAACSDTASTEAVDTSAAAEQTLIIDTHIDIPFRLHRGYVDVSKATDGGDFDYPRAKAGGLNAAFMSIYIPAAVDEAGDSVALADKLIDDMENLANSHPDKFAIARCSADIEAQAARGLISMPLGMENGGPVAASDEALDHFYQRGIRYITLSHSKSNALSDSSYDLNEAHGGLSPLGKDMVVRMNNLGVMVDVSHISDAAFEQVIEISQVPVIASHSSLRHYTPGFRRNMTDDMVKTLAEAGGVIQINYGSSFISAEAREYANAASASIIAYQQKNKLARDAQELRDYREQYRIDNPYPFATMDMVLDHIDRAVELGGIDSVGIGSDYDGVGDSLPIGLKDASTYGDLMEGLRGRGYSQAEINKIMGGNTLRVWRAVEAYAQAQGNPEICAG